MSYDHCHHEFASSGWIFECFQDSSSSKLCPWLLSRLKFLVTVFNKVVGCQLSTILQYRTHPKTLTWWSSSQVVNEPFVLINKPKPIPLTIGWHFSFGCIRWTPKILRMRHIYIRFKSPRFLNRSGQKNRYLVVFRYLDSSWYCHFVRILDSLWIY